MELRVLETPRPPAGTWTIDTSHSEISFSVRHLLVSTVRGVFGEFRDTAVVGEDLAESAVDVTIDSGSVDTRVAQRDEHLRGHEFLDSERHPEIKFRSTAVIGEGAEWVLLGELTMLEISKTVEFHVEVHGIVEVEGGWRVGLTATTQLDRRDFGVGPARGIEGAGAVLGDTIEIVAEVQAAMPR